MMIKATLFSDSEVDELEDDELGDGCQFCGHDRPFVVNDGRTFMECGAEPGPAYWVEGPFHVMCDLCKKEGPVKLTPVLAVASWKAMKRKPRKTRRKK